MHMCVHTHTHTHTAVAFILNISGLTQPQKLKIQKTSNTTLVHKAIMQYILNKKGSISEN